MSEVRHYLLSIKADVGPGKGFEESSRFATEFMRLKLGDMRTILCHVPDNQWKARQFGHVILHVALNSADVEKIYRWFNAGDYNASELWAECNRLARNGSEESMSWLCDILDTLGFKWV